MRRTHNSSFVNDVTGTEDTTPHVNGTKKKPISFSKESFTKGNVKEENTGVFPVDVIPGIFHEFISECSRTLNFPIDYIATSIIAAVSTAIGKSIKLKVKNGWYEFCIFYFALVGDAGANKSHPMELAFTPFEEIDRGYHKAFQRDYDTYEAFQSLPKKDKELTQPPLKPKLFKTILHNFTSEILHQRMSDNPRGNAVVNDEYASFVEGMNNYSKGDLTSTYLSFWSAKGTSIDRVSKPIPLWLPEPFLNIIGTIQFRALPNLFPAKKRDNGFFQRHLWACPADAIKHAINDEQLDEKVILKYRSWFTDFIAANPIVIDEETGKSKPIIYQWEEEAKKFFYDWQAENTDAVNDDGGSLKGEMLSKFDIHFVRLALVMQVMINYKSKTVSLEAAKAAAKLCAYYQRCADRVLKALSNGNPLESLPQNKVNFYSALPDAFTTAEANEIGDQYAFNVKAVQRFLKNEELFTKQAIGRYSKKV